MKTLVLFDLDGTLTSRDTLPLFLRHVCGNRLFLMGMLACSPWILAWKLGWMPNWKSKEYVLRWFLRGKIAHDMERQARHFSEKVMPALLRPEARDTIQRFRLQNATMVVVTASADWWVRPWAEKEGMEVLASHLEVVEGRITGKLIPFNCYGPEKARRIREKFDLKAYDRIEAFGDSRGDREMLDLAHEAHYRSWQK